MRYLLLILILLFSACNTDKIESLVESITGEVTDPINQTIDNAVDDIDGSSEPACPNPILESQTIGSNGNLYKPVAEGGGPAYSGNPVFLASSIFTTRFDTCSIKDKSGKEINLTCIDNQPWTGIPYSCFANGNRQHWRFPINCKNVGKVQVTCRDRCQEVKFSVSKSDKDKTCERFG